MPNLDDFLEKKQERDQDYIRPVDGSFQCQNKECSVITYEAFLDSDHKKIKWTCSNGHDSSVAI